MAQKRRKAAQEHSRDRNTDPASSEQDRNVGDDSDSDLSILGIDDDDDDDDEEEGEPDDYDESFNPSDADLDLEELALKVPPRAPVKENPYVAPTTDGTAGKWVPRLASGLQARKTNQLHAFDARVRGLTNRISAPNLISLSADVERLYRDNPRQHVSSALIDQLLALVCNDSAVTDNNFLLLAASPLPSTGSRDGFRCAFGGESG